MVPRRLLSFSSSSSFASIIKFLKNISAAEPALPNSGVIAKALPELLPRPAYILLRSNPEEANFGPVSFLVAVFNPPKLSGESIVYTSPPTANPCTGAPPASSAMTWSTMLNSLVISTVYQHALKGGADLVISIRRKCTALYVSFGSDSQRVVKR